MEGGVRMPMEGGVAREGLLSDGMALRADGSWRALVASALLAVALTAALWLGLSDVHSSVAPAHLRASSRLGPNASHNKGLASLPQAAQGPISRALGAENPAYRVTASSGGLAAASPAQRLTARFERSGVAVSSGAAQVRLSLRAMGYGSSLTALAPVTPRAKNNRVLYERAGLSEWYTNGPVGLEQGFTIPRAPTGHPVGALTLSMALSGNAHAALASGGQSVILSRGGRAALRYSGLTATDARGHALHSWLQLDAGRLELRVDARGARYPVRIDPFVQQGGKLTGGGERGEEGQFGYSVAMSLDGNTALIGGYRDNGGVGAAWVFTRASEKWTQQGAKLTGKEESGAGEFGRSVSLSAESESKMYAVIGGPGDNANAGAAWILTRTSGVWSQQGGKLTAKAGEEIGAGEFGASVSVAATKGEYALIGAPGDKEHIGGAFVFFRTGTAWAQQGAKLVAKSGEETGAGEFGKSVAVSAEGVYALMGAPFDKPETGGIGAAWTFLRTGTAWAQQAKLLPTAGEETGPGQFGYSVALSAETESKTYALIGAPQDKEGTGAAWVFLRTTTTWTKQAKLAATGETGTGEFGESVALAATKAEYALVGAPNDNSNLGAAYAFLRTATSWAQQAKLVSTGETGAGEFGESVALSGEGKDALMGGPSDNSKVGAAWVFTRTTTVWTQQGEKLTAKGGEEIGEGEFGGKGEFAYSVAMSPDGNTSLIGAPGDSSGIGAVWVFTRASEKWTQQGAKITAKAGEEIGSGEFGKSVALSAESESKMYAVIGAPGDSGGVGAAWVFTRASGVWSQQGAKLTAKAGEEPGAGEFGYSVSVAATKGEYALIGAPGNEVEAKPKVGSAFVFFRTGTSWAQQGAKLVAKSGEETGEGQFGKSVAVSPEGVYALMGAPGDKENTGAAWTFLRTGTTWAQQAKLLPTAGEETGFGQFGASVALSAETESKTYALIGAPADNANVGAAWVFLRTTTTWTKQAKILATGETGAGEFGKSVALAATKGEYALIGGPNENGGVGVGAAYAFLRTATTWAQQAKLSAVGEAGLGELGYSVALSGEGKDALVGAPGDNVKVGAAWVFTRTTTVWTQQGEKLTPKAGEENGTGESEGGKGQFGYSMALSSEGNTALIGAPADLHAGAAWVFTRTGTTWTQQGERLIGGNEVDGGQFGASVALSSDGNTALIGGPNDNNGVGAAWVFTRASEKWTQQGTKLTGEGESGVGKFGAAVALSSDGNTALIGGPNDGPFPIGAVWVFTRSGSVWTQQGSKLAPAGLTVGATFGDSVALSGDGNTALAGAEGNHEGVGGAFVFTRSGSVWSQQGGEITPKSPEEIGPGNFGVSVALATSGGNTALIAGDADHEAIGAAWVFTRSGTVWTQQGAKLVATGETGAGELGTSVALSAEGNTALLGAPADNTNIGAAWIFARSGTTWTQQGEKLTAKSPEEVGEGLFGYSVALSSEGNTGLIGGPNDSSKVGAGWVFVNTAPTVVTKAASPVAQTTATLNATVNPDGGTVSECKFEYGTTETYGSTASCASLPGSGNSAVAVSAAIATLTANTTYHFRISATNPGGTSKGSDETFKTPPNAPTVVTVAASALTQTTATLNATVNPNSGEVSECKFEYGPTETYGSTAACSSLPGSGSSPVAVSAAVTGLTVNSTYHFRISATNAGGTSKGSDLTLKTLPNAPTVVTKAASPVAQTTATLTATVNPNSGEVTECKFEYGTTEAYGSTASCASLPGSGSSPVAVSAAVTGLTANITYHFRISATNAGGTSKGSDETFKTLPNAPTVETKAASAVTQTTATLNANVNPNGGEVTECKFEYGTSETYGSTVSCAALPGSGTNPVAVSAPVTGLAPGTTYHFRISATNAGGTSKGSDVTLKTVASAPTVVTKPASAVAQTTATLNATVNPNGGEVTDCKFEVGETATYAFSVPCSSLPGSGSSPVAVTAAVTGLNRNTTYHFRISATNAGGTSKGSDETFKTLPSAPAVVTKAASPVAPTTATLNATVNPEGATVSECKFEYGPTEAYGSTASCASLPGSGSSPVAVSAAITGLTANTTYHFRISATNPGGTSKGSDLTLKTATNTPTVVTESASAISQTGATLNATVNPNTGEVTDCKFEVGETESYNFSVPCSSLPGSGTSPVAVSAVLEAFSLSENTTYHFRISATNAAGTSHGLDKTFKTLPRSPAVVTKAASPVAQTTATLNATVNPEGGAVTDCKFEYGTTVGYGSTASCASLPGSGTSPVAVSAAITGLTANTTYHFRISATNAGGTSKGSDLTLTTVGNAPAVVTKPASAVAPTTATLNATVNPNGGEVTSCKFEVGETEIYTFSVACSSLPGSGSSPVAVSAELTGLDASTRYHFRISATNAGGTSKGADATFKTLVNCTPEGFCQGFTPPNIEGSFKEPNAVAVDSSGNIFVGDSGNNRVLEFNSKREFLRQFGSTGAGEGQFQGIAGIAVNASGNVYVSSGSRIQEFSASGEFLRQFGSPGSGNGQFNGASGIAIDASGNVWVLDTFNYRIEEFSATGVYMSKFGSQGSGAGQLGWAYGLAISAGNLYVSEFANSRVQEFSTAGTYITGWGTSGSGNGQFHGPWGIASDPKTGNLYVADIANNRIEEFSSAGAFVAAVGTSGSGAGQLSAPRAVAVNSQGNLFVADTANNRIQEWLAGKVLGEAPSYALSFTPGNIEGSFKEPNAVAVDSSGNIFVGDSGHNRVLEFNFEREYVRQFGSEGSGEGQFQGIAGIATDASGDVYVSGSSRIEEFSPTGTFIRQFGSPGSGNGQFNGASGIAIDASGNVWVLDTFNYRIEEFSSTGVYMSKFGSQGSGAGQLGWAYGLAISGGNLYVSEFGNSRVQEFSTAGTYITGWGTSGSANGQFHGPWGIASDPKTGRLYVADMANNRIEEFSSAGAFVATFGTAGSGEGQLSAPRAVAVNSAGYFLIADTGNNRIEEWLTTP